MKLMKREDKNHKAIIVEDKSTTDLPEIVEQPEVVAGIPPRRTVHGKKSKTKRHDKRIPVFLAAAAAILLIALWGTYATSQKAPKITEQSIPFQGLEMTEPAAIQPPSNINPAIEKKQQSDTPKPPQAAQQPAINEQPEQAKQTDSTPPAKETEPSEQTPDVHTPSPAAQITSSTSIIRHKVMPGETLYRISLKYYHSGSYSDYLARVNRLKSPADLISGMWIKVPSSPR